jgi:hypothetical protein
MGGTRRAWNEAGMTYYGEERARSIHGASLGGRILLIAAVVVPLLVTLFVIFWFIREYISPPMAIVPPTSTLASRDAVNEATPAARLEMDAVISSASSPIITPSSPSSSPPPRPPQMAVTVAKTHAPAFAEEPQSQSGASPSWPPIAAASHAPMMSPAEAIAVRSVRLGAVPLPRRRPAPTIASTEPSTVPLPRNRPEPATDTTTPVADTVVEKPDRNF